MQVLRIVLLLVTLAIGYILFFSSQPKPVDLATDPAKSAAPATTAAHSQYKEAMNRAQAVANQMQAERKEADSY